MRYDVIIIGARCAGSPTAMLLARKGYRVLLVDRATFPSDILSSHFIHSPGVARLKKWGLLDQVAKSNCPAIYSTTADLGAFRLTGFPPPAGDVATAYCIRRKYLDKILVDAAAEAGAEVRERFTVRELIFEDQAVTGIRGQTRDGKIVVEKAGIVIGADGMHSIVARQVQAAAYNVMPPLTCNYYSYWSGLDLTGPELFPREGRFCVAAPTNDGLTIINVMARHSDFRQFRSNIEGFFFQTLDLSPEFVERVRAGNREERYFGTADTPNFFRKSFGAGWALAGDAGYHRDAITAQGISDAFRDADCLAEAVHIGLSGVRPLDEALAEFQRRREASVLAMYELTCGMAKLAAPSSEQLTLFEALRDNQAETDRFVGTIAGSVAITEFYSPANQQRILGRAPELIPGSPARSITPTPAALC
jgi:flavin-dependent dehydrogenase